MTFRVWHERQARMTIHCAYDQLVRVADLKPHPKNPNTHSAAQVAAIAAVTEGNGWRAPITVSNRSGFITRGHGRLEAATLLGCEQVPVDFQDYTSEQAELADMLADNHLAELAGIDEDRLVGVLKELQAASHDVGLGGFTEDEVARLTAVEEEIAQLEPIPKMELQAAAAARRGHAFWDHSATLGIRTCCGWSFGHSHGPVVVPRCAHPRRQGKEFLVSTIRPHANSFDSRLPENALPAMLRTKF